MEANTALQADLGQAGLSVDARVEVHTRYEPGRWARGFTVCEVMTDGYRLRRTSDGAVLSDTFRPDEIRVATSVPAGAYHVGSSHDRARREHPAGKSRSRN